MRYIRVSKKLVGSKKRGSLLSSSLPLVLLGASLLYFSFVQRGSKGVQNLRLDVSHLRQQSLDLTEEQALLQASVSSQSDPAWVEGVLIRTLGMVPRNYQKVCFSKVDSTKSKRSSSGQTSCPPT